jgi:hypothetical protein
VSLGLALIVIGLIVALLVESTVGILLIIVGAVLMFLGRG